jgi:hypothetical protein
VKNEKRWSYDNRPYGSWNEKLQAHLFPPEHPYHHTTIGSMEDLDAASVEDVSEFFRTYYAPNNAVLSIVGDVDPAAARTWVERYFSGIPANPAIPPLGDLSLPPILGEERRETVYDKIPLPRVYVAFRAPVFGDRRLDALDIASQVPGRWQGQPPSPSPRPRRAHRPGRRPLHARLRRRGVDHRRLGDRPPGRRGVAGRGGIPRGARADHPRAGHGRRAGAGEGTDRERRAGRASPDGRAGRPPLDVRDAVR